MSCFGRFARFRANRFRGRVGDESVSVGDERRRAANRRRGPTTDATPWLYARSFGERVCLPRRLGRTFNALARMEAVPPAAAAAAVAPASARRSWRGGFALRDGRSAAGGAGAGEPRPDRERVFLRRDTRSTMSRRFVRACVSKTATRRTRDVEQVRRAFRERVAKRASLRRRPRQPQRARLRRDFENARQRPRDLASGARSRRGGERGTHKYATLVF